MHVLAVAFRNGNSGAFMGLTQAGTDCRHLPI
jgi:hypothetical protein